MFEGNENKNPVYPLTRRLEYIQRGTVVVTLLRELLKPLHYHSTIWHQTLKPLSVPLKYLVPYSAMMIGGFQGLSQ